VRYEELVQDEAQVGVHPSLVSHLRGVQAASKSMTSTAPRSNGSYLWPSVGLALFISDSFLWDTQIRWWRAGHAAGTSDH